MTQGADAPRAGEGPSFDVALRGYDKQQVDQYLSRIHSDMTALAADRHRARVEVAELTEQLKRLGAELGELRSRPTQVDRAAFSDLGPMVNQMLVLAEKQAGEIISAANQRASGREAEADKALNDARERSAQITQEFDAQMHARRTAAEKAHADLMSAAEAELTKIRGQIEQTRAEGESAREQAEQEARHLKEQHAQAVSRAKAAADALLEAARTQAEQEVSTQRADLQREIDERRTEAAQKIANLHIQAQQQADEVRQRMQEQSAAHQQQLAILQEEIQAQRDTLAELQSEMDAADHELAKSNEKKERMGQEFRALQQRLDEVGQALGAQHNRLDEAKRAGEAAEQYAREVRARVQREAKRVAEMAAAAVMAAATGSVETGEFPRVVLNGPDAPAANGASRGREHKPEADGEPAPVPAPRQPSVRQPAG
jgi:DivIVA domain-containing protein